MYYYYSIIILKKDSSSHVVLNATDRHGHLIAINLTNKRIPNYKFILNCIHFHTIICLLSDKRVVGL